MDTVREVNLMMRSLAALVVLAALLPPVTQAQESPGGRIIPSNAVVTTGYGTVGYLHRPGEDADPSTFSASFAPIFLFQFQDRIMFESELEFEVADGVTETGLEYAHINVIASDNVVLVGGKFLVPFGVFSDRLHPTWINKFATPPPLYGHHTSEFGAEPLMPVLSDLGVMAKGSLTPGPWALTLNGYVAQGPSTEGTPGPGGIPELEFPGSTGDTNDDKMVGGRLDVALPPWMEVNVSWLNADYDENAVLDLTAWNVAAEGRYRGLEARGEYIETRQEFETLTDFPTLLRRGFYTQASYRRGPWEPVLRFTKMFDDEIDGVPDETAAWQAAFGLNYWFAPSVALMAGYELNREDALEISNDRLIAHVAFGF